MDVSAGWSGAPVSVLHVYYEHFDDFLQGSPGDAAAYRSNIAGWFNQPKGPDPLMVSS